MNGLGKAEQRNALLPPRNTTAIGKCSEAGTGEVVGRGKSKRTACYSNSPTLQMSENDGSLRGSDEKGRKSLPGASVKANAKMKDGRIQFYKDGYTALRGRFDYASLSTNNLDNVQRFALPVVSDGRGDVVREVAPPARESVSRRMTHVIRMKRGFAEIPDVHARFWADSTIWRISS